MHREFEQWHKQARFWFMDKVEPLEKCGNCGKNIVLVREYKGERLLIHIDKTVCVEGVDLE